MSPRSALFRRAWAVLTFGVVLVVVGCGGQSSSDEAELLSWAGFEDIGPLEVVEVHTESRLDTYVAFVLRGDASDMDAAIEAADLDDRTVMGVATAQPPLGTFDPDALRQVRSMGMERWRNGDGVRLTRSYARGVQDDGQTLVQVWAFTT